MRDGDLRVDGNQLGGALLELFGVEMTGASSTCGSCRQVNEVARAVVYTNAPGVVARCPGCGHVLMRLVRGQGRVWLDLSGVRCLEFAGPGN
jgi:hypothetical protein